MAVILRESTSSANSLLQFDTASPFQRLELEFSKDELRETSYEIFAAACKAASGIGAVAKTKTGLSLHAPQKSLTANAASSIKKALGLRSSKKIDKEKIDLKSKKHQTMVDIVRLQMGISDQIDMRIRRALSRTAAGQVGKNVDLMLLPVELLQQIRLADFADPREYQLWQKRQLKVLEAGLLLHPTVKLEQSNVAAQRMKQLLVDITQNLPLDTGKNSEKMIALRTAATILATCRSDDARAQEVCHWADGFPFNLHLYQTLLSSCFDKADVTNLIDEVDDAIELFKKSWRILGINQALHNLCFLWLLFRQFVATGQNDLDLLTATEKQMTEVAKDAEESKDAKYCLVLSSVMTPIQTWAEKRLLPYHDTFPEGGKGLMESILPIALCAAKILNKSGTDEFFSNVIGDRIDMYIRSSLRTAFAQLMDERDSSQNDLFPRLVSLASRVTDLMRTEREKFSPILKQWHPFAASVAAGTLHSCFSRELKEYLSGVKIITVEAVEILQSADQLEKELAQIVVEDVADSDDGGKGFIQEMIPFEAQSAIVELSNNWIHEMTEKRLEWVERKVKQEDWNPEAIRERHAPSIVELFGLVEETLDAFFALSVPLAEPSISLQDVVLGLDKVLQQYVAGTKTGCGLKKDLVPSFPALTRCKNVKHDGCFGGASKKKGKGNAVTSNGSHETSSHKVGFESSRILCVRINTLYYIKAQTGILEDRLSNGWQKYAEPTNADRSIKFPQDQSQGVRLRFEQTMLGVQEGMQLLTEIIVYNVVFRDIRSEFWEGLYCGSVANARIDQVLRVLEGLLVLIAGTVNEHLRNSIKGALMRACFEAFLMVLLAGGPSRAFLITDTDMIEEDLGALKDVFKAHEEGLPSEIVEKAAMPVTRVLSLFAINSEDIIGSYKQSLSEVYGQGYTKSKLPLPEFTGQWSPTDPNTLLRILCYRCDSAASKFLKKAYNLPRGN